MNLTITTGSLVKFDIRINVKIHPAWYKELSKDKKTGIMKVASRDTSTAYVTLTYFNSEPIFSNLHEPVHVSWLRLVSIKEIAELKIKNIL